MDHFDGFFHVEQTKAGHECRVIGSGFPFAAFLHELALVGRVGRLVSADGQNGLLIGHGDGAEVGSGRDHVLLFPDPPQTRGQVHLLDALQSIVAVVAEFEPEIAANRPQAPRLAIARPPRSQPRQA